MNTDSAVQALLESDEPAIRFKIRTGYLGEDPNSKPIRALRNKIRDSPLVACLLRRKHRKTRESVYAKWQGAHWVLAALADLGYPPGDEEPAPPARAGLRHWLDEPFYQDVEANTKSAAYRRKACRSCVAATADALRSRATRCGRS